MAEFTPAKYQVEIHLDKVQRDRLDAAVAAAKDVWTDGGSVAWNYAPAGLDTDDPEIILTGYGWLFDRTPEQLADALRSAVVGANGRGCAVSIIWSQLLGLAEQAATYGPRGARQQHELRGGKYVRVD